ncbi:hypothetical protein C8Q77DRAFT_1220485 [Trametes polyzona]|nr:hypothetical protein C8Q77DRAFT_1220485 [Trametes polyzona]
MTSLRPYQGLVRKLVVAMDIGTTFSGVSYAILDPGEVPKIQGVTRFPGQENAAGDSKIPSILYYRPDGTVHSAGAEAALPGIELEAEDDQLVFVEWFKLHLRPETLDSEIKRRDLPPLPEGKTVLDVFADFMNYLFNCTKRFVTETHASGESLWTSLEDRIEFVLSHPNGWEGLQQSKMRQAAIMAGLVPDTPSGRDRVHFVTEGEASLHFCIRSGLATESVRDGESVMIVDAGGGTVDISSYKFVSTSPLSVEEITTADCIVQGSTRVNAQAKTFLQERLKNSPYGNEEDIKAMVDYFNKSTKPIFKDASEQSYIKFGSMGCNDPKVKIRRGQLLLSGPEMESFYQPSLDAIVSAVEEQERAAAAHRISTVFLVGGFAASPWLYTNLQRTLKTRGLSLSRPDSHTNKAVAEGGVSFYLAHVVSARIMRTTFGVNTSTRYKANDPEHAARVKTKFVRPSGKWVIPGAYSGTRVLGDEEKSRVYHSQAYDAHALDTMTTSVVGYRGPKHKPRWRDLEPESYAVLCTISADTSGVTKVPRYGPRGIYYKQHYSVVLICGPTELKAQIQWTEEPRLASDPPTLLARRARRLCALREEVRKSASAMEHKLTLFEEYSVVVVAIRRDY